MLPVAAVLVLPVDGDGDADVTVAVLLLLVSEVVPGEETMLPMEESSSCTVR